MPFIRRTITDEPECSQGQIVTAHEFYCPRAELKHGDLVLDPTVDNADNPKFIRAEVLAGLAVQFPREFSVAAKARNIALAPVTAADSDDDEEDDDPDAGLAAAAKEAGRIVKLAPKHAAEAIAACDDADVLAAVAEIEGEREKPRELVVEALKAKGFQP
jgi:hypothetical protein